MSTRPAKKEKAGFFPAPAHMRQSQVIGFLGRQVFEDATAAGWLRCCVRKPGRGKDTVFYAFADVNDVSLRIAAGEYPTAGPDRLKPGLQNSEQAGSLSHKRREKAA